MKRTVFYFPINRSRPFSPDNIQAGSTKKTVKRRKSQLDSNYKLRDATFGLDWRPTGSGKGYAIRFSAVHNAITNPNIRIIIAAPSLQVCGDFLVPMDLDFTPEVGLHTWNPKNSTLNEDVTRSIQHIVSFLDNPVSEKSHNDRIMVTTHASLVRAYKKSPKSFKNILIFIDEAHHILYDTEKDEEFTNEMGEMQNALGALVEYTIKHPEANIRLHFSTATYVRGDKLNIIPEEYKGMIAEYAMPLSVYLSEECEFLESFTYTFNLYRNNPLESLMDEFKDDFKKSICYISPGNPQEKQAKVLDYLKAITKNPKVKFPQQRADGTVIVKRGNQELVGILLVEEKGRDVKYQYIIEAHEGRKPLDFIISLRTFIEGANWKQAEKLILIGYKKSITDILQRLGRLTRDCENKKHVELVHILPQPFDDEDRNTSERTLSRYNDYLKTVVLVMEQLPVVFRTSLPRPRVQQETNDVSTPEPIPNVLMDEVGNNGIYDTVVQELDEELLRLFTSGYVGDELETQFKIKAEHILIENGVAPDRTAEVINNFLELKEVQRQQLLHWNRGRRGTGGLDLGIDVSDIDFDIISGHKYVGHLLLLLTNKLDINVLTQLREVVRDSWEDMYKLALEEATKT